MKKYRLFLFILAVFPHLILAQYDDNYFDNNPTINEQSITAEEGYAGAIATGKYSVWYGCGANGQPRNHVAKPFIYIEGINLTPNNVEKSNEPIFSERTYLRLLRDGFDIVQLDFNNNPEWIQRNAELLITLIHQLQTEMNANGSNHEIVIMGESMGAVLTRYALTKMEHDGENHNVRLFLSLDGPHNGANVPYGLQYFLEDLTANGLGGIFVGVNALSGVTDTFVSLFGGNSGTSGIQAAFQLLQSSPNPQATIYRAQFVIDMLSKGNYPNNCRKIAFANGANNGTPISSEGENHQVLRLTNIFDLSDRRAHAAPGVELNFLGLSLGTRIVFGKIIATNLLSSKVNFYPAGLQNWDLSPGGTYFRDDNLPALGALIGYTGRTRPFCFVPTVSALGLAVDFPFFPVNQINGFGADIPNVAYTFNNPITPFDAIWADEMNSEHVENEINTNLRDFVIEETSPINLNIQNKIIQNGDSKIYEARGRVSLGNNITNAFPIGDVVFQPGSEALIRAGTEIIQDVDGVDIQVGSEVEFRIEFYNCQ